MYKEKISTNVRLLVVRMALLKYRILSLTLDGGLSEKVLGNAFLPHYHKDSLRKALSQLRGEGLLQERFETHETGRTRTYSITARGEEVLQARFPFYRYRLVRWDGLWRLVFFDVPEKSRSVRDKLRQELRRRGFGLWQGSVWVSPYDHDFFTDVSLLSPLPRGRMELFKGLRLLDTDESQVAERVWRVGELNKAYEIVYNEWQKGFAEKGVLEVEKAKGLASKLYHEYLGLLLRDPGLPRELLPSVWYQEKIRNFLWQWKSFLSL